MIKTILNSLLISFINSDLFQVASDPAFLTSAKSSVFGGGYLYLRGNNFDDENLNIQIFFNSTLCPLVEYYTMETSLVCQIPIGLYSLGQTQVTVISNGISMTCSSCKLLFDLSWSPNTKSIMPQSTFVNTTLQFIGYFHCQTSADIISVKIGNYNCELSEDPLTMNQWWSYDNIYCTVPVDVPAGDYKLYVQSIQGTGISAIQAASTGYKFGVLNDYYHVRIHPQIFNISSNFGYQKGQILTISGSGFGNDPKLIDINIDSRVCNINSLNSSFINCTLTHGQAPVQSNYIGGNGLEWRLYPYLGQTSNQILINSNYPNIPGQIINIILSPENILNKVNYHQRFSGLFYAPVTGNYTFMISSDDNSVLLLSNTSFDFSQNYTENINSTIICSVGAWNYFRDYFKFGTQICYQNLIGKSYYALTSIHTQYGGSDHLSLSVIIPNLENTTPLNPRVQVSTIYIQNSPIREEVMVTVNNAGGGTFNVLFYQKNSNGIILINTQTTPILWNETATNFRNKIQAVTNWQIQVNVTGIDSQGNISSNTSQITGYAWNIRFMYNRIITTLPFIITTNLIGSPITTSNQTIAPSPVITGTFQIQVGNETSKVINFDINGIVFKSLLEGMQSFQKGVTVFESGVASDGRNWTISFDSANTPVVFTFVNNTIIGGPIENPATLLSSNLVNFTNDSQFVPIPSNQLFTVHKNPQIRVNINNLYASCLFCDYSILNSTSTHTITSFSISANVVTITLDETITIDQNLITQQNLIVNYAGYPCSITSVIFPDIICSQTLNPDGTASAQAGSQIPKVHLNTRGFMNSNTTPINIELIITSVIPNSGSTQGGTYLNIKGQGFSVNSQVYIGNSMCLIQNATNNYISCMTTQIDSNNNSTIIISANEINQTTNLYSYSTSSTPTIDSLLPTSASPVLKSDLNIIGYHFGLDSSLITVLLKNIQNSTLNAECNVVSVNDTNVLCRLGGGVSGQYKVLINKIGIGFSLAATLTANNFVFGIWVDSISPNTGSLFGGTLLTIIGENFSQILNQNLVFIGNGQNFCLIQSSNLTTITCITPYLNGTEQSVPVSIFGRIVEEASCRGTCVFNYASTSTPIINSISPLDVNAQTLITIIGSGFTSLIPIFRGFIPNSIVVINDTTINFNFPAIPEGLYNLSLNFNNAGNPNITNNITFNNSLLVTQTSPTSGSIGGELISIIGSGFSNNTKIILNGNINSPIKVQFQNSTNFYFRLPNLNATGSFSYQIANIASVTCLTCNYNVISGSPLFTTSQNYISNTPMNVTFVLNGNLTLYLISNVDVRLKNVQYPYLEFNGTATYNDTQVIVSFPNVVLGNYKLYYYIKGTGFANFQNQSAIFQVLPDNSINAVVIQSPWSGGHLLQITGNGFDSYNFTNITVCGQKCLITNSNFTNINCSTPQIVTSDSFDFLRQQTGRLTPANITGYNGIGVNFLNDMSISTFFNSTSSSCNFVYDFGFNNLGQVTLIKIFPRPDINRLSIVGSIISGSNDNITWTTLFTIGSDVVINWNSYQPEIPNVWGFRFFKFYGQKCLVSEFVLYGTQVYQPPFGNLISTFCDVQVTAGQIQQILTQKVEYRQDTTPLINDVSPKYFPSYGGTQVSIMGSNLQLNAIILLDNIICPVDQINSNSTILYCVTGPRPIFTPSSFQYTDSRGYAVSNNISTAYIDRWSDIRTWGGEAPPRAGDSVYVPVGQNLLVDISPPLLKAVIVEGSIIWSDESDMTFNAYFIIVNQGLLQIGTPTSRYQHQLDIILWGDINSTQIVGFGNKCIAVQGGNIDIHGQYRITTWTLLAVTANIGNTYIDVQDNIDWVVGDKILISPSGNNREEFEEKFITSVTGKRVFLDSSLSFPHAGETQTFNGTSVELRAEVSLLNRNIRIKGDPSSNITEYGAHIMIRGMSGMVQGRFSYIEITLAGQKFQMGRYPLHFHMIGDVVDSYIMGCSVHHTFNRANTIHGVNYLVLENNVYYRHIGHGVFIEDSIEKNNVIKNNLVLHTSISSSLLSSDLKASGMWITRPLNFFSGNRVAGGERFGFWFELVPHPTGPSATNIICPLSEQLGLFENNTAHTNQVGLRIYPFFIPVTNPCSALQDSTLKDPFSANPPVPAIFNNILLFSNGQGFFGRNLGAVQLHNFTFVSNGNQFGFAEPDKAPLNQTFIDSALVVGSSILTNINQVDSGSVLLSPRKDGLLIKNTRIVNHNNGIIIQACNGCDNEEHFDRGGRMTTFQNITYINSSAQLLQYNNATRDKDIIYDFDGSLLKIANINVENGFLIPYQKHLDISSCTNTTTGVCSEPCMVCTVPIRRLDLKVVNVASQFLGLDLKVFNLDKYTWVNNTSLNNNFGIMPFRYVKEDSFNGWTILLTPDFHFNFHFSTGVDFLSVQLSNQPIWQTGEQCSVQFNATSPRELFVSSFTGNDVNSSHVNNMIILNGTFDLSNPKISNFGDFYYNNETKILASNINSNRIGSVIYKGIICNETCPKINITVVASENRTRYWSNPNDWTSGAIPITSDNVTINATWNMIIDVQTPLLNSLTISGNLIASLNVSSSINSNQVTITPTGTLQVGNSTNYFTGNFSINITGTQTDNKLVLAPGINPVNKFLTILGKAFLYGTPPTPIWSRLSSQALANTNLINVIHSVNWQVGDQLVIASSTKNPLDVEFVTITKIFVNNTIQISQNLINSHYGATTPLNTNLGKFDMRAEVGILNRNIKIFGNSGTWGCTILVPQFMDLSNISNPPISGQFIFSSVEIFNCGQRDTFNSAINLQFNQNQNGQILVNSSIHGGLGWAIGSFNSQNLFISNNIITEPIKFGAYFESSSNVTFTENLMIKINPRSWYTNVNVLDLIIGFFYNDTTSMSERNFLVANNSISSSPFFSWMVPGVPCTFSNLNFLNNTGHSSMAGWFAGPLLINSCIRFSNFTAYKNFDEGFVNRFSTVNIEAYYFQMADNNNSFALNGGDLNNVRYPKASIHDSIIYGNALTDCDWCYTGAECISNGIYTSLFDNSLFSIIMQPERLPLHNTTATQFLWGGKQNITNVQFYNFKNTNSCPVLFALRTNTFIQDTSVFVLLNNVTFINSNNTQMFYFAEVTRPQNHGFCNKRNCTGIYNTLFSDVSGTLFTNPTQFFGRNPRAGNVGKCTFTNQWNGYACQNQFSLLSIFQPDVARGPIICPIVVSLFPLDSSVPIANTYNPSVDDDKKFPILTQLGKMHLITFSSTMPTLLEYKLDSQNQSDWALFMIQFTDPSILQVRVNGVLVNPFPLNSTMQYDFSIGTHTCGENVYIASNRTIIWLMNARDNCVVQIIVSSSVQLSIRLDITQSSFYTQIGVTSFIDRMASLLKILPAQLKIVSVRTGSTIVDTIIVSLASSAQNITNTVSSDNSTSNPTPDSTELNVILTKIVELNNVSAASSLGAPILGIVAAPSYVASPGTTTTNNTQSSTNNSSTINPTNNNTTVNPSQIPNTNTNTNTNTIPLIPIQNNTEIITTNGNNTTPLTPNICLYLSYNNFVLTNSLNTTIPYQIVFQCKNCTTNQDCANEMQTVCVTNPTLGTQTQCLVQYVCPNVCAKYIGTSICQGPNIFINLKNAADICLSVCGQGAKFDISKNVTCKSPNCPEQCAFSSIWNIVLLLITLVLV